MAVFTAPDAWTGGFYELAVELGPRDDARLEAALAAVWADGSLQGCFGERSVEPTDQVRFAPTLAELEARGHLLGVATLPSGERAACGTVAVRETEGADWLILYVPVGSLEALDERVGAFPFDAGDERAWREPIDAWLMEIGEAVFAAVPFGLALVGHEVSGTASSAELGGVPPAERRVAHLCRGTDGSLERWAANRFG